MNKLWLERICLKLMDQICSLMETTMRHKAGDNGLPIVLPRHWRMHFCPRANVCMFNADLIRSWDVFDSDLSSSIEPTECTTLDDVSRIVGFSWVNRECFVV